MSKEFTELTALANIKARTTKQWDFAANLSSQHNNDTYNTANNLSRFLGEYGQKDFPSSTDEAANIRRHEPQHRASYDILSFINDESSTRHRLTSQPDYISRGLPPTCNAPNPPRRRYTERHEMPSGSYMTSETENSTHRKSRSQELLRAEGSQNRRALETWPRLNTPSYDDTKVSYNGENRRRRQTGLPDYQTKESGVTTPRTPEANEFKRLTQNALLRKQALAETPKYETEDQLLEEINQALLERDASSSTCEYWNSSTDHTNKTGKFLFEMYKRDKMTDVVLVAEGQNFNAHRLVLACHSDFFAQALLRQEVDRVITLDPCVSSSAMSILLEFMYTGNSNINIYNVAEVFLAASTLHLRKVEECCRLVTSELTAVDALIVLETSHALQMYDMSQVALQVIARDFLEACASCRFLQLNTECLSRLLSRDDLRVPSELDVLKAAVRWLNYAKEEHAQHAITVLSCIRFMLMVPYDLFVAAKILERFVDESVIRDFLIQANWYRTSLELNFPNMMNLKAPVPRLYEPNEQEIPDKDESVQSPCRQPKVMLKCTTAMATKSSRVAILLFGSCKDESVANEIESLPSVQEENMFWYHRATKNWKRISKLPQPRSHYALAACKRQLYVTGGELSASSSGQMLPTNTALCWNPGDGTWSQISAMCEERMQHCCVSAYNKLFVFGGCNRSRRPLSSIEMYNPDTCTWKEIASMKYSRTGACASVCRSGIMIAGGYGNAVWSNGEDCSPSILATVEYFSPTTLSCTEWTPLLSARCSATMTTANDKLYICGGLTRGDDHTHKAISQVDTYDVDSAIWTKTTNLRCARYNASSVVLGGKLCVFGGTSTEREAPLSTVECYDLDNGVWTRDVGDLPAPISRPTSIVVQF